MAIVANSAAPASEQPIAAGWQPIETAPSRLESRVLLHCLCVNPGTRLPDSIVVIGTRIDDDEWEHEEGGLVKNITHWMPLPEPPK